MGGGAGSDFAGDEGAFLRDIRLGARVGSRNRKRVGYRTFHSWFASPFFVLDINCAIAGSEGLNAAACDSGLDGDFASALA